MGDHGTCLADKSLVVSFSPRLRTRIWEDDPRGNPKQGIAQTGQIGTYTIDPAQRADRSEGY